MMKFRTNNKNSKNAVQFQVKVKVRRLDFADTLPLRHKTLLLLAAARQGHLGR